MRNESSYVYVYVLFETYRTESQRNINNIKTSVQVHISIRWKVFWAGTTSFISVAEDGKGVGVSYYYYSLFVSFDGPFMAAIL